jgi:hypothetical protein
MLHRTADHGPVDFSCTREVCNDSKLAGSWKVGRVTLRELLMKKPQNGCQNIMSEVQKDSQDLSAGIV